MYAKRQSYKTCGLPRLSQRVGNISKARSERVYMPQVYSKEEKLGDLILDRLYKAEEYKGLICFTIGVTVVSFFAWQVLKAWVF